MSAASGHPHVPADGEDRVLIIQSGIERTDTVDLLRQARPGATILVDDTYEALARIGMSDAGKRIQTVMIPLTIPDYAPKRVVQAFRRIDGRLRLILIAPTGRSEACSAALRAGFDAILEIPSSANSIKAVLNGELVPTSSTSSSPTPRQVTLDVPPQPSSIDPPPAASPPAPRESGLAEIDLLESLLDKGGNIRDTAISILRTQLGTDDVHLVLPEDAFLPDGRAHTSIQHEGREHGILVSRTIGNADLERWAEWLSRWLELEWKMLELARKAETDELTGAGNRRAFDRVMHESIENARPEKQEMTLMVFDIDNFKTYNDKFGHEAGDEVLRETVELLRATIRRGDHVFRIGGDEFVVLFCDREGPRNESSSPPESVEQIARRFQAGVCDLRLPQLGADAPGLSISAGMALYPWDGTDAAKLLRHADALALESKRAGKNLILFGRKKLPPE